MQVALLLLALMVVISLLNRSILNPTSITLGVLALSTGLASLRLYGLFSFDPIAESIILAGGASLFVGAVIMRRFGNTVALFPDPDAGQDHLIRYRVLTVALVAAIVVMMVSRAGQIGILLGGGSLAEVRNSYLGYGGNDATIALVDRLFVGPLMILALPIFLWSLLRGKINVGFAVSFASVVLLNQLTSGGRFIFLYAGVMVLALLARPGATRRHNTWAKAILVVLAVGVLGFTIARGNSVLFEAYTYFAIPVPLLAHWATTVDAMGAQTFGAGFAYGGLTLLFRASELVGHPIGSEISTLVALPQEVWVDLLPGRHFNAFVTLFYYFYLDFGWVGVVLGALAWGFIAQWSFNRMWGFGPRSTIFGLLMLQVAVLSFVRWEFTNGSLIIALVMLPLVIKSSKRALAASENRPSSSAQES
ncbi:O-antigen polymerase [Microbacterium sp. YY-03]|uniref:O-antigen polymerase n=1 Tax=Microbacterium sp. YY-03 TaxID=3421636 RepID=UPI003D181B4D